MLEFQETGVDPGWINNGGLFIANNKERMEEYRRLYTMGKVLGIESHLLSPEETKVDIEPLFRKRHSFPKSSRFRGPRFMWPRFTCVLLHRRKIYLLRLQIFTECAFFQRLYPLMNVDDIYGTLYSPLVSFFLQHFT